MYASIRQAKAKTGMAEELARRIKEGAIPIISDVEGFRAYYVVYAPDDTVTAISIFNDYAGAAESNRRILAWIEQSLTPLLAGPVNFRVDYPHVPCQSIIARERLFLRAQMTADLLFAGVVDRILVPRKVVRSRKHRIAGLPCRRILPHTPVGAGLRVA